MESDDDEPVAVFTQHEKNEKNATEKVRLLGVEKRIVEKLVRRNKNREVFMAFNRGPPLHFPGGGYPHGMVTEGLEMLMNFTPPEQATDTVEFKEAIHCEISRWVHRWGGSGQGGGNGVGRWVGAGGTSAYTTVLYKL